ncbi:thioredoxin domain-containing protein [Haloferula helveola]|uniref:Thioredoxin domain-containing protein n=1 Tax=Haloferula helveola TaxID=490095 RepID=A0ABM7RPX2_9BACT|nr:thioredoxin domain-containing protein [Haloferula helveola]
MKALPTLPALITACFLIGGCDRAPVDDETSREPIIAPELRANQVAEAPSTFLHHAGNSKIHWQRWNPDLLQKAEDSQRLIFALIGSARYPGSYETLSALEGDPDIVSRLNNDFVPVLVDLDICRETALMASALSAEARTGVSFPFLLLLAPDGSPVSWLPIRYENDPALLQFFDNSVEVLARLWAESPKYVLEDSAAKTTLRKANIPAVDPAVDDPDERDTLYRSSIRRLTSFYDEDVQTLAGTGGLIPLGVLEAISVASIHPDLPDDLKERSTRTRDGLLDAILHSAIIDPLDGGIYTARRGSSWNLPIFIRDCATQARAIRIFCRLHVEGANPDTLDSAKQAASFAESQFRTSEGLFAMAAQPSPTPDGDWLWTIEQLKAVLTAEEYKVWDTLSEFDRLGNLPSEADPQRRFFRLNSLALRKSFEDASTESGLTEAEVRTLAESGRKKLLKAREERFPSPRPDGTPSATASFRMVSAYAALHTATGDPVWKEKAQKLGKLCRESFGDARFLNERPGDNPEPMSDGRALTYAIAAQAAMDLGAVTLEDEWNLWAQDLCTLLGENFVSGGDRLDEARPGSKVINLDYEDRSMVFGDSTAGLTRLNLSRLAALGFQTPPALHPWTESIPPIDENPVIYTDSINALAHGKLRHRIAVGPDAPAPMADAIAALPLERFERRSARQPGGTVEIIGPDRQASTLTTVAEIKALDSTKD